MSSVNRTLDDLLADEEWIGYPEMAEMTARDEQTLRVRLLRRNQRIKRGRKPLRTDIPEPAGYVAVYSGRVQSPRWRVCDIVPWAMREGMIEADGVTPIPYPAAETRRRNAAA